MLNPKHQRYADRIRDLINEGYQVAKLDLPHRGGESFIQDQVRLQSWIVKTLNIIETVFGQNSAQYRRYESRTNGRHLGRACEVEAVIGVLVGALDDLESGFLTSQEFIIAGDVFDSLLEQAKYLNETKWERPAAVLSRIALEDALRRLARGAGISESLTASAINDKLKEAGRCNQVQWRLLQVCLDVGNKAAHPTDGPTSEEVEKMIDEIRRFLAAYLTAP